jgi:hypothetical protein
MGGNITRRIAGEVEGGAPVAQTFSPDTSADPQTVTLPDVGGLPDGYIVRVVDAQGNASVNNITINDAEDAEVTVIDEDDGERYLVVAGGAWEVRGYLPGGGGGGIATHPDTAEILAASFGVEVEFANAGGADVLVGLALSGAGAADVRLYPGDAYTSDLPLNTAEAVGSINALLVPAGDTASIWIARAAGEVGAVADCTLTVTQPDGSTTEVEITAEALATLEEYAAEAGFTSWWSFPAASSLNDQIGTANLTGSGTRGAAELRGAGGTWTPGGAATRTGAESPGRDADGCLLLIFDMQSSIVYPNGWAMLGTAYNDVLQFCQVNAIGGTGTPDNDPGDSYNAYALRVQGPGSGGSWVDTAGLVVPELSTLASTPGYTRRTVAIAVNFDHATGCYSYLFGGAGREVQEVTSATAVGTEASAPTAFTLFSVSGGSAASAKYHAAGFIKGAKITEAQFRRLLALAGLPA